MWSRRRSTFPKLPAQKSVLSELLPLADRSWNFEEILRANGWDVIQPRLKFEMSFGDGDEIREYREVVVELVKCRFASPNIRLGLPLRGSPFYSSQYLDDLRARRDIERGGRFDPHVHPWWMGELAICLRRMELLRFEYRAEFDTRMRAVVAEERHKRSQEIERNATGMSRDLQWELTKPESFYSTAVQQYAKPLGFVFDSVRSLKNYPVYSKRLTNDLELCLTPEPLVWYPGKSEGEVRIKLSLQPIGWKGSPGSLKRANLERFLCIEYSELVRHLEFLYHTFSSLEELETLVIARMFFLSLVLGDIESGLLAGLQKIH